MDKIRVSEFVTQFSQNATEALRRQYVKDNLVINTYVSVLMKDTYAQLIVDKTMFEQEEYTDEEGNKQFRKTDKLKVMSVAQYIQFCRAMIELYTNLLIENNDFIVEYDLMKQSGLLDMLLVGSEQYEPLIPVSESSEFRTILDFKVKDVLTNYSNPQNFFAEQVDKIVQYGDIILSPIAKAIETKLGEDLKEETLEDEEDNADSENVIEFKIKDDYKEV